MPYNHNQIKIKNQKISKVLLIIIYHTGHSKENIVATIKNIKQLKIKNRQNFDVCIVTNVQRFSNKDINHEIQKIIFRQDVSVGTLLNEAIRYSSIEGYNILIKQDADDISIFNRIDMQCDKIRANKSYVFFGGSIQLYDESTNKYSTRKYPKHPKPIHYFINKSIPHCALAINLKNFQKLKINYPTKYYIEDKVILCNLDLFYKIYNQDQTLVVHKLNKKARSQFFIAFRILKLDCLFIIKHRIFIYLPVVFLIFLIRIFFPIDKLRTIRDSINV